VSIMLEGGDNWCREVCCLFRMKPRYFVLGWCLSPYADLGVLSIPVMMVCVEQKSPR
jgi:hypothetical protein